MKNTTIDVRPLTSVVGAEIHGVDLSQPLADAVYLEIRNALNEWGVIFFRDQDLTQEQHVAFSERFGPLHMSEFRSPTGNHPAISDVRKEPEQRRNIGGAWHSDHSFDENPPLGSILVARVLPETGGDTMFASAYAAYDSLSEGMKKTLGGMRALHSKRGAYDIAKQSPDRAISPEERARTEAVLANRPADATHPVCPRHPESGRRVLFVNPTYTMHFDGWTAEESAPLLDYLYRHMTRPENTCRFSWRTGSIAFWDNRSVLHYALNDYHGELRSMHRVTVLGDGFPRA